MFVNGKSTRELEEDSCCWRVRRRPIHDDCRHHHQSSSSSVIYCSSRNNGMKQQRWDGDAGGEECSGRTVPDRNSRNPIKSARESVGLGGS